MLNESNRLNGIVSVDAVIELARLAAARITSGALDHGGVERLAHDLGVTARHLRRVVERECGASPVELAQTRRLLTAKHLLADTRLPITQVALTSGFRSVRRFNALFRARYRMTPTNMRRSAHACGTWVQASRGVDAMVGAPLSGTISLALAYRPPFDWDAALRYLAPRATPTVEAITSDGRYWRGVRIGGSSGVVVVRRSVNSKKSGVTHRTHTLVIDVSTSLLPVLSSLLGRLRSLFDLDADPQAIGAHLTEDPILMKYILQRPGLRVLGTMDGFDLALRSVLGQQVSVRGATTLASRLTALVARRLPLDSFAASGGFPIPSATFQSPPRIWRKQVLRR